MNRRPRQCGRDISGVLLLDKPSGIYSNRVVQEVKHIFNANKAGHTGALDPLASGMLPICLGEATKFSQYLLNANKRYIVIAFLGERTDTSDANGNVIKTRPLNFNKFELYSALNDFLGDTMQIPSMYSALKHKGQALYKYARKDIIIKRNPRLISVYKIHLIYWKCNFIKLEIFCSKGTYIRTIIDDLGEKLGCGAHVIMLRRIHVAHYSFNDMITLEKLNYLFNKFNKKFFLPKKEIDSLLLPIDSPVIHFPVINLSLLESTCLKQGRIICINNNSIRGLVRVTESDNHKFIGIARIIENGCLIPHRLIV